MKVSIITASYNCGKYLKACISSVQAQKYDNYEHVILNDCSTDNSAKILRKYAKKDSHIKVITPKKRLKCGSAYAELCNHISGDIVGVLDSDDALAAKAIKTLVGLYTKNPDIGYIWTQFWLCDQRLNKLRKGFSSCPPNGLLEAGMRGKHCFSHWRTFRRNILEKGPIFKKGLKSAVDKYMGYAMEELAPGAFTPHVLYKYRQRVGGLSYTGRKNWKRMKVEFSKKREDKSICVFPIRKVK